MSNEKTQLAVRNREARVQQCIELMRTNQWRTGETIRALAEEWGIVGSSARNISGEASRRLLAETADKPRLQNLALLQLEEIATASKEQAALAGNKYGPAHTANAIRAYGELLAFTQKANAETVEWEALSLEEKWLKVDEAQARVDEIRAKLSARPGAELPEDV